MGNTVVNDRPKRNFTETEPKPKYEIFTEPKPKLNTEIVTTIENSFTSHH